MEKEFEKVAEATKGTEEKASVADYEGIKVGNITARYLHLLYVTLPEVYSEFSEILNDEYDMNTVDNMMKEFYGHIEGIKAYIVNNGMMAHIDDMAYWGGKIKEL